MDSGLSGRNCHLDFAWASVPGHWVPLGSPPVGSCSNRSGSGLPETLCKGRWLEWRTMAEGCPARRAVSLGTFRRNVLYDSGGKRSILFSVRWLCSLLLVAEQRSAV